jgi:hypothetical protein
MLGGGLRAPLVFAGRSNGRLASLSEPAPSAVTLLCANIRPVSNRALECGATCLRHATASPEA